MTKDIKVLLPELNQNQRTMLLRLLMEVAPYLQIDYKSDSDDELVGKGWYNRAINDYQQNIKTLLEGRNGK